MNRYEVLPAGLSTSAWGLLQRFMLVQGLQH